MKYWSRAEIEWLWLWCLPWLYSMTLPEGVDRTWNMEGEKDRDRDTRGQERQRQEESWQGIRFGSRKNFWSQMWVVIVQQKNWVMLLPLKLSLKRTKMPPSAFCVSEQKERSAAGKAVIRSKDNEVSTTHSLPENHARVKLNFRRKASRKVSQCANGLPKTACPSQWALLCNHGQGF